MKTNDFYEMMIFFQPELWKKLLQTTILSEKIGQVFEVCDNDYILASYYMNIGYLGISRILNDNTKLSEDDKKEIRRHPKLAAMYLEKKGFTTSAKLVHLHHERPDGMGYYGEQKYDKRAAFLQIADSFIGQISSKSYCNALTVNEAIENFREIYERSNLLDIYEIRIIEKILIEYR